MTDEEYLNLLTALAKKHLRLSGRQSHMSDEALRLYRILEHVSGTMHLLKVLRDRDDSILLERLVEELKEHSPVRTATDLLEAWGILDALDDAPGLVLSELRRPAIPREDEEYLRIAGFDSHDIEVLFAVAIHQAHALASTDKMPSDVAEEAAQALQTVLQTLQSPTSVFPPKKKRKVLNGIGKLLGGATVGIGNVLLLVGTVTAPNPATGYGAIGCGGIAVASFFAGLGDLRGE